MVMFSAEFARIRPTEVGYRVDASSAYLALHDFVRTSRFPLSFWWAWPISL